MGEHRDETQPMKSLEESILENIDAAAESVKEPVLQTQMKLTTIQRFTSWMVVLTVLFCGSTVYTIFQLQKALHKIESYQVRSCEEGNKSRASERGFIQSIFDQSEAQIKKPTPQQVKYFNSVREQLIVTYPVLDCSKVKKGQRVVITPGATP